MRIIAIETSSPRGSVALGLGDALLAERAFAAQTEHARELFVAVDELCREAGWEAGTIEDCYLSIGPGSFTGLRVAVTFARMLSLASRVRLCAVPTLEVIAQGVAQPPTAVRVAQPPSAVNVAQPPLALFPAQLAVMLPARRDAVFGAIFERAAQLYTSQGPAEMIEPRRFIERAGGGTAFCGEGAGAHREAIASVGGVLLPEETWFPRAAQVLAIGRRLAAEGNFTPRRELVPLYIRRPEAEEVWERRNAGS